MFKFYGKKITKKGVNLLIVFIVVFLNFAALAQAQTLKDAFSIDPAKPLGGAADKAGYADPTGSASAEAIAGKVVQTFLSILGIIFLILMIYAGYSWMTAHGDEQKVTKAKDTITASIIGLVIVLGAYALTFFVISKLTASTLK